MMFALPVSPRLVNHNFLGKGGLGKIGRKLADTRCRNANPASNRIRVIGIVKIGFGH